jgi:putative ABC transport system ATP-binding protein
VVVPDSPSLVFAARALTKLYQMGEVTVQALRGVDFDLFGCEFVVLLGPSGSGKSTLLNILGDSRRSRRAHLR